MSNNNLEAKRLAAPALNGRVVEFFIENATVDRRSPLNPTLFIIF